MLRNINKLDTALFSEDLQFSNNDFWFLSAMIVFFILPFFSFCLEREKIHFLAGIQAVLLDYEMTLIINDETHTENGGVGR